MKQISLLKELFCIITLGLLTGWYYFILFLVPALIFCVLYYKSIISGTILATLILLTVLPLNHTLRQDFVYSWVFKWWCEYFDFTYDADSIAGDKKLDHKKKYMAFEVPHGVFPMGQVLSLYLVPKMFPTWNFIGTGADAIFKFPVIRQFFAAIGVVPVTKDNITKILKDGNIPGILVGGIAEMFLVNDKTEAIYLKKRLGTVKAAIKAGANILPIFFFGNTKFFKVVGGGDENSYFSKLSRSMKSSIVLFYGRFYLPIPFRHPLHMVTGEVVEVVQTDNPSDEEINKVMNAVIKSIEYLYEHRKPTWESRPLIIT